MKLKYALIASEENDYQPFITKPMALAVFILIIWALRLLGPTAVSFAESTIDAGDLMVKINIERTQRFIPALITDQRLDSAASVKSSDMLARSYFAHQNPENDYVWPTIEKTGYTPYLTLGENLAMDFVSADAVVRAWMNSPTHRENIVNDRFQDQGMASIFGLFEPNHNSILITNLFGTLLNSTPAPAVAKASTPTPPPVQNDSTDIQPEPAEESEAIIETNINPDPLPQNETEVLVTGPATNISVSEDLQFLHFFQIFISILVAVYALLLIFDSIIIHNAKIQRVNMHASPHTVIFLIIILTNLLTLY
ncbi:MAG: CAP domain-containing protein [bacterium]|nr:CAP domain-containing protein [bacterium]